MTAAGRIASPEFVEATSITQSGNTSLPDVNRNDLLAQRLPEGPVTAQLNDFRIVDAQSMPGPNSSGLRYPLREGECDPRGTLPGSGSDTTPPTSGLRYPLRDGECDPRGPYLPPRPAPDGPPAPPSETAPSEGRPVFPPPFYPTPGTEGAPIGRPGEPKDTTGGTEGKGRATRIIPTPPIRQR